MPAEARRLLAVLMLCFCCLAVRLGYIQFISRHTLAANPHNPRLMSPASAGKRGGILARGGEVISAGPGPMARECMIPSLCHTAGYLDPRYGASGLEAAFDRVLSGRDERAALAAWLASMRGQEGHGADLVTTIDLRLQEAAARALAGRPGAVVVINAVTGDILVLVSEPIYTNPPDSRSWAADNQRTDGPFVHRALQGVYPPGSAGKIVAAAAALEAGFGSFTRTCAGQVAIGGRRINEANQTAHGTVDLRRALAVSCNVFFVQLAREIGGEALIGQARYLGLGIAPPCDLPTGAGFYPPPASDAELMEAAIGQGRVLVTPLQMATIAAALVNNGVIMRPRLIEAVEYADGSADFQPPRVWRRAMRSETAAILRDYLEYAVVKGTGRRAAVSGWMVGGKTGTAQVAGGIPHAWFVGFARQGAKRLGIAVVVEHGGSGGVAAAPIAAAVWRAAAGGARF